MSLRASSSAAVLLALFVASTGGAAAAEPAAAGGPAVVLITLDTTRADHLGAWGWPHARTPNLDALAARGTRFARCDSAVPITLPSHATILSGLYPPRHGVRDNATFVLAESVETVAEGLAAGGFDTAAVVSAAVLARRYGLAQGFRLYDDDLAAGGAGDPDAVERRAAATTAAATALLPTLRRPYFLWVHYFDPHEDYAPPPPYAAQARGPHAAYDGEIAYMDAEIGRLLAALPADATVLVVGDHGEMLGDGGEPTHGLLLGHGARRVPLLLAGPGIPGGRTVDCLTRTADVAPTLYRLAGLAPPAGLDGASLLPLLDGDDCGRTSYAESFLPFFAYRWYPLRAFSEGRWLYVHGTRPGLYDLAADPAESRDVAAEQPAIAGRLAALLKALLAAMGERLEGKVSAERALSDEERARLESLGYVGGGAGGEVRHDLPDPRDMVGVAADVHRAAKLVRQGRCADALPLLLGVTRRDRYNFPAYNQAGLCLLEAGRLRSALNAFERAAQVNPQSAVPLKNAGNALLRLGEARRAEEVFARAFELDPISPGVASNLAALLRGRGAAAEAAAVLERAFAAGSRHPGLYLERGMLAAARGDVAAAFDDFLAAAERDPHNPVPLDNAAKAAELLGRPQQAAELYRRSLDLDPGRPALWAALATLYLQQLGDRDGARHALEQAIAAEPDPGRRARLEDFLRQLDPGS